MTGKRVFTPKDEEFKKLLAAAVIDIAYCEMYPGSPACRDDEDELEDEWVVEDE